MSAVARPRSPRTASGGRAGRLWIAAFAALVYAPLLTINGGRVVADTKSYLYIDPARLMARAASLWDPKIGMGTLSHQTIGYLFPMGPYYWFTLNVLHLPVWVAQRLWVGSIIVAAGLGVRYLLRTLGVRGPGIGVAMLAYAFTPYILGYVTIYSALLMPWAALGWWIGFTIRALRTPGWKYPALFAITVQVVGSVNGSALLFALIGPALWVVFALVGREVRLRTVWAVAWRTGLLGFVTSLWWFGALVIEGRYGVNILRFTESVETVSATAAPYEILRGLGNWFFYGTDRIGPWVDARPYFTQRVVFVAASFVVPLMALLSALVLRWRHRAYFVVLALLGVVIGVGAAPYDDPSLAGGAYKWFALNSTLGFALRNTGRALPLVAVSLAVLLGAAVSALDRHFAARGARALRFGALGVVGLMGLLVAAPLFGGAFFSSYLERDDIPGYWRAATARLDAESHATRVLALPGADFASYRWGDTREPVEPGLMDRPYVAREIVPWGSPASVAFLRALDHRVQEGTLEPAALGPIARLMSAGDLLLRFDLQTDRYSLVPAGALWQAMTDPEPQGLGPFERFGTRIPGKLKFPEPDDLTLPADEQPSPPPVAVAEVRDALPVVRAKDPNGPLVVGGDAEGLVDLAGAGLLDPRRLVLFSAPLADDPAALRDAAGDGVLVLTDSNRKRGERWSGMAANFGATETSADQSLRFDPLDQRLGAFEGTSEGTQTILELSGVRSIAATSYGESAFGYRPGDRPSMAFDGDPATAWTFNAGRSALGERVRVVLDAPITTDRITLRQFGGRLRLTDPAPSRRITAVSLRLDGAAPIRAKVAASSVERDQTVRIARRTFRSFELEVVGVQGDSSRSLRTRNPLGFSEIGLRDEAPGSRPVRIIETTRMPTDLLATFGAASGEHPLALAMTRDPAMDNNGFRRRFELPAARSFAISGEARLSTQAADEAIDAALGLPGPADGAPTVSAEALVPSAERLQRPIDARAAAAVDGDPETAWITSFGEPGAVLTLRYPEPTALDRLDVQLVADGRHSVPTRVVVDDGSGAPVAVPFELPAGTALPGGLVRVPVSFPTQRGREIRLVFDRFRRVERAGVAVPAGIAEIGAVGFEARSLPAELPSPCRSDLVRIDGRPWSVRIVGRTADAVERRPLRIEPCGPDREVRLGAGSHDVEIAVVSEAGQAFDVERLVLTSAAGGAAAGPSAFAPGARPGPRVTVTGEGRWQTDAEVDAGGQPFWLVLGQSYNEGWQASADGADLGTPVLADGYANAWYVTPRGSGPVRISLAWAPQRAVIWFLGISALGLLVCLAIVAAAWWRARLARRSVTDPGTAHEAASEPELATEPATEPASGLASGPETSDAPELALRAGPGTPGARASAATVVCVGLFGVLFAAPWVGLAGAVAALVMLRVPHGRAAVRAVAAGLAVVVLLGIPVSQLVNRFPPYFDWPGFFDWARLPTWLLLVLLLADVAVDSAGGVYRTDPDPSPSRNPDPPVPGAPSPGPAGR